MTEVLKLASLTFVGRFNLAKMSKPPPFVMPGYHFDGKKYYKLAPGQLPPPPPSSSAQPNSSTSRSGRPDRKRPKPTPPPKLKPPTTSFSLSLADTAERDPVRSQRGRRQSVGPGFRKPACAAGD